MQDNKGHTATVQEFAEQICATIPKETCVYKAELKAEDYPTSVVRALKCTSGDVFYIVDKENIVKVGDKFKDCPAVISGVEYTTKRWWQFWKRRKQKGYFVRWLE